MTVKELWDNFDDLPFRFALCDGEKLEITPYPDRMEELVNQYADSRVKMWRVGILKPSYYLHVTLYTKEEIPNDQP